MYLVNPGFTLQEWITLVTLKITQSQSESLFLRVNFPRSRPESLKIRVNTVTLKSESLFLEWIPLPWVNPSSYEWITHLRVNFLMSEFKITLRWVNHSSCEGITLPWVNLYSLFLEWIALFMWESLLYEWIFF